MLPTAPRASARYDALWQDAWTLLQSMGPLTRTRYRLILRELEPYLEPAARVLDAGCGNGTLLTQLSARYATSSLYGIEFSEQAIARAPDPIRSRIAYGDLRAELPSFSAAPVDILVSSEVLEHLTDPIAILRLMREALKPGGIAAFTVPAGKRWWSSQDEFAGHVQRFEPAEFRHILEETGFEVVRLYSWGIGPALLYDRLTAWLGPKRTIGAGRTRLGSIAAAALYQTFWIEDLFRTKLGFQIIAIARRA